MTDDDINGVAQTGVAVQLGDLASNTYFLLANLLNTTRAHRLNVQLSNYRCLKV